MLYSRPSKTCDGGCVAWYVVRYTVPLLYCWSWFVSLGCPLSDVLPASRDFDTLVPSRYVVGIDLGTTNSAVCFVDTANSAGRVATFRVPQLIAPGQVESRDTLPSFLYQAAAQEFPSGALRQPWQHQETLQFVGVLAREQGKLVPGRAVESAKSWLCHAGVDRTAPLLPWQGSDDVQRMSPVEVSAAYLAQIRSAWDAAQPAEPLAAQDIVITLPASFDEVARELTIQAAKLAGLPRIVLIEEPQAAFYSWIDAHRADWETRVAPGQNILVCDVGGGTSDFTLIRVRQQQSGAVQFHRIAVGEHLILGGDNIDLALARHLEPRLSASQALSTRQWGSLVRLCRQVKESLLGTDTDDGPEQLTLSLPGSGSKLIGGGLQLQVTRDEVRQLVLEGFFPEVPLTARPIQRRSGFQEFGLPYAPDAGITRYLATFLQQHGSLRFAGEGVEVSQRPDVLLFNGGVFVSPLLRERVVQSVSSWYRTAAEPDWTPVVLANARHDLAVAQGAAYYGMVRRGAGVRIAAGLPRTYYIGLGRTEANKVRAVCLVPAGLEPGEEVHLTEREFDLTVATPVEFPLYHSSVRLTDQPGEIIEVDQEQLTSLPPIRTVLRSRKIKAAVQVRVQLHTRLTELGTLQMWCSEVAGNRNWQIQFDVRSATQTERAAHTGTGETHGVLDTEALSQGTLLIENVFGSAGSAPPQDLPRRLAESFELSREAWPPSLLRGLWDELLIHEAGRRRSPQHEARWLNLLGFSLRPGFGVAMDDWRVAETWKQLQGKLYHPTATGLAEWRILWRRIAGGLPAGQQLALATPVLAGWRDQVRRAAVAKSAGRKAPGLSQADAEVWRMLGSLELLPVSTKIELGDMALVLLEDQQFAPIHGALVWALGRMGARQPFYGPLNSVVPIERVAQWLPRLLAHGDANRVLAVMQLARRTQDRYRDLSEPLRDKVLRWLGKQPTGEQYQQLVSTGGELAGADHALVFGESLPTGLRLR